jgi:hypothetical protein
MREEGTVPIPLGASMLECTGFVHHEIEWFFTTTLGTTLDTTFGEIQPAPTPDARKNEKKNRLNEELQKNQHFGPREDGGITISRRPNRRASSEYAPGPNKTIAVAMTIVSKDASLPSNRFPGVMGTHESAIARLTTATEIPTTGVRNPIRRQVPQPMSARQVKNIAVVP